MKQILRHPNEISWKFIVSRLHNSPPPPSPTITFSWRKIDEYLESQLYSFYVAKNIVLGSLEEFHTYVI